MKDNNPKPIVARDKNTGRFERIAGRPNKREREFRAEIISTFLGLGILIGTFTLGWYACVSGFFWFLLFLLPFCLIYSLYFSFKHMGGPRGFVGMGAFLSFLMFLFLGVSFLTIIFFGQSCPIPTS